MESSGWYSVLSNNVMLSLLLVVSVSFGQDPSRIPYRVDHRVSWRKLGCLRAAVPVVPSAMTPFTRHYGGLPALRKGRRGDVTKDQNSMWSDISGLSAVPDLTVYAAAAIYQEFGLPVFPVHNPIIGSEGVACSCAMADTCDRPGKHPRIRGWNAPDFAVSAEDVQRWWSDWPDAGIGLPTGAATDLVVVDLDTDHEEGLNGRLFFEQWLEGPKGVGATLEDLAVPYSRTGSGGLQLFFRDSRAGEVKSMSGWLPLVDVRGRDGFVILPPSMHKSGNQYKWEYSQVPSVMPDGMFESIGETKSQQNRTRNGKGRREATTTTTGQDYRYFPGIDHGPPAGGRDEGFNAIAYVLRKQGAAKHDAYQEIRRIWRITEGCGAGGIATYALETALLKVDRAWERVVPDPDYIPMIPASAAFRSWALRQSVVVVSSEPSEVSTAVAPVRVIDVPATDVRETAPVESEPFDPVASITDMVTRSVSDSQLVRRVAQGAVVNEEHPSDVADRRYVEAGVLPPNPEGSEHITVLAPSERETDTDMGAAARFARLHGRRVRYVKGRGWIAWNGTYWVPKALTSEYWWTLVNDIEMQALAAPSDSERDRLMKFAHTCQSSARLNAIENALIRQERICLTASDLNTNPNYLVVRNGTLDLSKGELITGKINDFCTSQANVDFDPDADCPEWLRHVNTVSGFTMDSADPELAGFLQRWVGYTLSGSVDAQKFAFLYGEGANGKNVLVETVMKILGGYAGTATEQLLTGSASDHPTTIADLDGYRMVFVDESPKGRINDSRIKQLTGSEKLKARRMHKDPYEFYARFKLWIAGNHKPRVSDGTEGWWRRLDLVPFGVIIPREQRIEGYSRLLYGNEASGILNWAMTGYQNYQTQRLAAPRRVTQARDEYREEENTFSVFMADNFDRTMFNRYCVPDPVIVQLYVTWCKLQNLDTRAGIRHIGNELRRLGYKRYEGRTSVNLNGELKRTRGWFLPPITAHVPWASWENIPEATNVSKV